MLSVSEALELVMQSASPGSVEFLHPVDCTSRTLAQDQFVSHDSPPFDKAVMDGFAVSSAVRGSLSETGFLTFSIAETITAGMTPQLPVREQIASRIMTGAPLPDGCDCVVPVEQTTFEENDPQSVSIPVSMIRSEANIIRRGTAARSGSVLLRAGSRLQPQQIAALAEFGICQVPVYRRPQVAVLATGDELIGPDQPLTPGKIRNSNEPMLLAQAGACGAIPVSLGIARDQISELEARISEGLQYDVFLLTGGVSAGLLDLVPRLLREAGVKQVFHGVHMKPGKPLWFGRRDNCLVFGLPGNPVSSLACFELFVRPALRKFSGLARPNTMCAVLSGPIKVGGNRPVYQPVAVAVRNSQLVATPITWSSSSDLRATVEANGMSLLLPEHGPYREGDTVEVWLWGDERLQ